MGTDSAAGSTQGAGQTRVATCHCGAVEVEVPQAPSMVSDCNCSICRRYGVLWAYYPAAAVRGRAAPGATDGYAWGRKAIRFGRCGQCGCVTHWERIEPAEGSETGVNARNFPARTLAGVPVELLDGATTAASRP